MFTTTLKQTEIVAHKLGISEKDFEVANFGGESVIITSEEIVKKICADRNTTGCSFGKEGKYCLTNLRKFL